MKNVRNPLAIAIAVAVALTLSGCLKSSAAPQTTFILLDGSSRTAADLQGKVVLINFWATSCVAQVPKLASTYDNFRGRGYETIAVAMSYDRPSDVVNLAQTRKLPFPVAIDNTGAVAKAWGDVKLTPMTYLVNKRGEIVKRFVGQLDFVRLHQLIDQLLSES